MTLPLCPWCDSPILPTDETTTIASYTYHEACLADLLHTCDADTDDHANYWTTTDAKAAADVDPRTCIHGVPRNVYCGNCEP